VSHNVFWESSRSDHSTKAAPFQALRHTAIYTVKALARFVLFFKKTQKKPVLSRGKFNNTRIEAEFCAMGTDHLERELKNELQRLEKKLRKTETLRLMGWIGSIVGASLVLSSVADQIPVVDAIAFGGALLNLLATRFVSPKK
jgi:hypothetical protein